MYLHLVRELLYKNECPSVEDYVFAFRARIGICARVTYIVPLSRLQVRGTLGVGLKVFADS